MPLRPDDVNLVARLAHLRLTEAETVELTAQLARIVDYMAQLDSVDVSDVEGTSHVVTLNCPVRDDREVPSLERKETEAGAPEVRDGMFVVPRIIG